MTALDVPTQVHTRGLEFLQCRPSTSDSGHCKFRFTCHPRPCNPLPFWLVRLSRPSHLVPPYPDTVSPGRVTTSGRTRVVDEIFPKRIRRR